MKMTRETHQQIAESSEVDGHVNRAGPQIQVRHVFLHILPVSQQESRVLVLLPLYSTKHSQLQCQTVPVTKHRQS